jgi:DNA-binding NarL/FixJ family response regulator
MSNQSVTIALVDDHALIRKAIGFRLKSMGYNVVMEAEHGKHFLDQLASGTVPEICLLDINMPVMNGFETLGHLKTDYPDMKVVFFSMNNDRVYMNKAEELGAHGYVTKDANMEDLDRVLKQLSRPVAVAV